MGRHQRRDALILHPQYRGTTVSARKDQESQEPRIRDVSYTMLRNPLDSTRTRVAATADAAKAGAAESNPEVTRVRQGEHGDGPDDLRVIADAQRGHAETVAATATDRTRGHDRRPHA
jgi:hypothetical protein